MQNIVEIFLQAADEYPNRVAIVDQAQSISYAELKIQVKKTAAYFQQKGIQKGDRILVFVPMSVDLYRIVLAIFYVGATAVFLDEWVNKKRLEICCQIADCKGFVGIWKARVFALFSKELRRIPIKLSRKKQASKGISMQTIDTDDAALITFTTGSTGTPKAARRTHEFLKAQFDALLEEIEPKASDIDMPVLPIVLFMNLGVGCTSVIADFKMSKPEQMDASKIVAQLSSNQVSRIIASPYFVKRLAQYVNEQQLELIHLQKIFTGGAPVFPAEAKQYLQAFPNAITQIVYGSTEAEPISSIGAKKLIVKEDQLSQGLPVGIPFHQAEVKIIQITSEDIVIEDQTIFEALILPEGEIGEIVVAGKHVLKQYFNNEAAFRANKIIVGKTIWHRTGDSGFFKGEALFLTGRCKQLIVAQNGYISPFIIENELQSLEEVSMGTLMKVGEELVLVIEGKITQNQQFSFPFDRIQHVTKIPRDPRHNSKINYGKLKALIS
ncbi:MAG: AMP-binding protein [Bacteroidota bacterium]